MRNTSLGIVLLTSVLLGWGCGSSRSYKAESGGDDSDGSGGSSKSGKGGGGGSSVSSANAAGGGGKKAQNGGSQAGGGGDQGGGDSKNSGGSATTGGAGKGASAGGNAAGNKTGGSGGKVEGGAAGNGSPSSGGSNNTDAAVSGKGGASAGTDGGGTSDGPVTVQLDQTKQTIEGFGINNNWAPSMDDTTADALFDTTKGLGLNVLRVGMGSNGSWFNSSSPQDISKAKARGAKYIIGSLWSPPKECKDNNNENDGGHLLESCYGKWSDTIAKFAKDNSIYAMSPQNEPDFASCGKNEPCNGNYPTTLFTAAEMVAFMKVVGPKLQAAGVKVIAPEASEWLHTWSNESATGSEPSGKNSSDPLKCGFPATKCAEGKGYDYGHALYKDKEAWAAFDFLGVHQYDTQVAEPWPADVPDKKPVWQTEMSGVKWWPQQGPTSDIDNGVAVAGWIHNALTVGEASVWCWWWYSQTGDNEGLLIGTTDTKRHYTFGNYTKFVRPGSVRVNVAGAVAKDVLLSAYKGTDGTVVVVAINKGTADASVPITIAGGTAPASLTPWVTSASDNLVSKTAVAVSGGSFTAALASMTVTTFVGK